MSPLLKKVRALGDYKLELTFEDGLVAVVDFANEVLTRGGIWAPLHDKEYFRRAYVEAEGGVLTWPNQVDYCPDVLYSLASGKPIKWAEDSEFKDPANSERHGRAKAG